MLPPRDYFCQLYARARVMGSYPEIVAKPNICVTEMPSNAVAVLLRSGRDQPSSGPGGHSAVKPAAPLTKAALCATGRARTAADTNAVHDRLLQSMRVRFSDSEQWSSPVKPPRSQNYVKPHDARTRVHVAKSALAKRLRSLKVDHQFVLGRQHNRQVTRLLALRIRPAYMPA